MTDTMPRPRTAGSGPGDPALLTAKDLLIVVGIAVLTPVAGLVPERAWHRLTSALAAVAMTGGLAGGRDLARRLARYFDGRPPAPADKLAASALGRYIDATLQVLRGHRPGGWRPAIDLAGAEHLQAALERGRGAILWVSFFHSYSLISKIAVHRAGFAVSHLSHPRHGFSGSRFGMAVLNRLYTSIEDRYLGERVSLSVETPLLAMRTLTRRLEANGVVSITAREAASRPAVVPFLAGTIPVATGAPDLAHRTGAALLPLHTVLKPDGRFAVIIEPPIALPDGDRDRRASSETAARLYAERLEAVVRRYPDQWRGWFHLGPEDDAG